LKSLPLIKKSGGKGFKFAKGLMRCFDEPEDYGTTAATEE